MRVSQHLLVLVFLAGLCSLVDSYVWRPIPGAVQNISKNDKGVKKAVLVGTYSFNNKSNDAFLFRASAIDDAKRQIVKGIRYVLTVEISRTMCRKMGNNDDLPNCPFQTDSLLKQIPLGVFYSNGGSWSLLRGPGSYCQLHRAPAEKTACDELDKSF